MDNPIKDARKAAGLTQQQMSDIFNIPKRTIEEWDRGNNYPRPWVEQLLLEKLYSMKK